MTPAEHPILMAGQQVRAVLGGRMTVTRRLAPIRWDTTHYWGNYDCWTFYKGRQPFIGFSESNRGQELVIPHCPFGRVGDTLWVRETWRPHMYGWQTQIDYAAGGALDLVGHRPEVSAWIQRSGGFLDFAGARADINTQRWFPSIHMPRWAARLFLRVESVTVERVQDITEEDAEREGVEFGGWVNHRQAFADLWDSLAPVGLKWADNPWVWRVGFTRIEVNS